jgi:hypothetical protein
MHLLINIKLSATLIIVCVVTANFMNYSLSFKNKIILTDTFKGKIDYIERLLIKNLRLWE